MSRYETLMLVIAIIQLIISLISLLFRRRKDKNE